MGQYFGSVKVKKIFLVLIAICTSFIFAMSVYATDSDSLQGRVIILDPGHGAGADNVFAGYSEQKRMLFLAHRIQENLEARGATVLLTRPSEANVSLSARAALMNMWSLQMLRDARIAELENSPSYEELRAEINEINRLLGVIERVLYDPETYAAIYTNMPFCPYYVSIHPDWRRIFEFQNDPLIRYNFLMISLHSNATPGPPHNAAVHGADIYRSTNTNPRNVNYFANYSHTDITYIFADMLLDGINAVGIQRRSISPHHWFVIRETNLPAVLVENGFHTNARDRSNLQSDAFMRRLAETYTDVIERYFAEITSEAAPTLHVRDANYDDNAYINETPPIMLYIEALQRQSEIILTSDAPLFANIGDEVPVETVEAQAVWILDIQGSWVLIATWLGPMWIMV